MMINLNHLNYCCNNSYFYEENKNILIPNVGFKFLKAGVYIIELDLKIKIRRDRNVKLFYLNYIHNKTSYLQYDSILNKSYDDGNIKTYFDEHREHKWKTYMRFDIKSNGYVRYQTM